MSFQGSRSWGFLPLLFALGCSSAPPQQAKTPDPPLEDSPTPAGPQSQKVAPASSAKVQQGIDAIQRQDFAAAKSVLSEAHTEAPKDAQAAFYLGVAFEGLGDLANAEKSYREAHELDPALVDASANLSAILVDGGKTKEALPIIEAGLKAAPKHPELLVNHAIALEAEGKHDEAIAAYEKAVAVRPDAPDLRLAYAALLAGAGKKAEALEQVRAAAKTDDPKLLAAAADVFGRLKSPADCVAALDRALKAAPSPALQVRRGVCRHAAGDDAGAQADYEAALKLDARFAAAHYYLGLQLKARDKKGAQQHLQKASELDEKGAVGKAAKEALDDLKKGR
ncbi:MAG TPA: tetratricopeptide repeat protein [Polyangiaceae bacterium]|nr:tetratricopeptide repeat protein [Polyangiaceae bacterium]